MERKTTRREFLRDVAVAAGALVGGQLLAGCGSTPAPTAVPTVAEISPTAAPKKVWLGNSIRSLADPYHASWDAGGKLFAADMDLSDTYQALLSEGDSTKQVDDLKAMIAKAGKDVVFNIDPNEGANVVPCAQVCEEAGVYFVTQWNKPDDLHPWDYKYWVAHMQADDYAMGYDSAKAMCEALGGKGKVVHIQGMLGNPGSVRRFEAFQDAIAEYPDIEFLEAQPADWDQTKAQSIVETWLVKYPELDGIHTSSDGMSLGAVAAIKAARPEALGKIVVTGMAGVEAATRAILAGEMHATVGIDAKWQGGMGLALPYHAYLGTFDPAQEPNEHREFYFATPLVTKENAQTWLDEVLLGSPTYDWSDLWGNVLKQIEY